MSPPMMANPISITACHWVMATLAAKTIRFANPNRLRFNFTTIACAEISAGPAHYAVGRYVEHLSGTGLVLQNNNSDELAVFTEGSFTFAMQSLFG